MNNEVLIKVCGENYSNEIFQMAKFFEGKGFEVAGIWGEEDICDDDGYLIGFDLNKGDNSIYLSVYSAVNSDNKELKLSSTLSVFELLPLFEGLGEFIENAIDTCQNI